MDRRRVLFLTTLTAATLAGAAAGVDATCAALSSERWSLSPANLQFSLLVGAAGGQFIGLVVAGILLKRRPKHAFAGAAWGAAAGSVGVWFPLWAWASAIAAC